MAVKINGWTIHGLNIIHTDSAYKELEKCIQKNELSESILQKRLGLRAPVIINEQNHEIQFCHF